MQRGRGRERFGKRRTGTKSHDGGYRLHQSDQSIGSTLLQHACGLFCLLPSPIVLVLRRRSRPRPFGQPDVPRRAKAGAFAYVLVLAVWCPFRAHRLELPKPGLKRRSGPRSGKRSNSLVPRSASQHSCNLECLSSCLSIGCLVRRRW
jgi:hypothetical protein